ncbi:hypothetical protein [Methylobacterium oxalidis]
MYLRHISGDGHKPFEMTLLAAVAPVVTIWLFILALVMWDLIG